MTALPMPPADMKGLRTLSRSEITPATISAIASHPSPVRECVRLRYAELEDRHQVDEPESHCGVVGEQHHRDAQCRGDDVNVHHLSPWVAQLASISSPFAFSSTSTDRARSP